MMFATGPTGSMPYPRPESDSRAHPAVFPLQSAPLQRAPSSRNLPALVLPHTTQGETCLRALQDINLQAEGSPGAQYRALAATMLQNCGNTNPAYPSTQKIPALLSDFPPSSLVSATRCTGPQVLQSVTQLHE